MTPLVDLVRGVIADPRRRWGPWAREVDDMTDAELANDLMDCDAGIGDGPYEFDDVLEAVVWVRAEKG